MKAGCPAGWLQNKLECYLFSRDLVTWYEASVSLFKESIEQYNIPQFDKGSMVIVLKATFTICHLYRGGKFY